MRRPLRGRAARQQGSRPLSSLVAGGAPGATFCLLTFLELRRPLRPPIEPKAGRVLRNFAIAAVGGTVAGLLEFLTVKPLLRRIEDERLGLLKQVRLPPSLEVVLAFALMDYSLYAWHILVHQVPWLWRFHRVHHADVELDASTATRFHFGELAASVPFRAAQIRLIGVGPRAYSIWQTALLVSILFHHSNVRLPDRLERWLRWLVVTPRMHGIHHSADEVQRNCNWSSGLTCWDLIHRTCRMDLPREEIRIGLPEPPPPGAHRLLAMPFRRQPV